MPGSGEAHRTRRRVGRRPVLRSLAGAGTASLSATAGCNTASSGSSGDGSRVGSATRERVALEYADVTGERARSHFEPAIRAVEDEFDVRVDLTFTEVPYDNMYSTLLTRVGGGNAPDVAALDQVWLGTFVENEALLTLDAVADDVGFDDYLDAFAAVVRRDDHVYGLPIGTDVRGMYWNKSRFEAAGLDPERPPETWSGLLDVAERLHDPPESYGATYFVNSGRWTVTLLGNGGRVLNDDESAPRFHEPPGIEAARFVDRLYNGVDATPREPVYRNAAQMAREFLDGQYAVDVVEGSWLDFFWRNAGKETSEMLERFGFAPSPHPRGGTPATMSGGFVWTGFADTDHPRLVRAFLRILNGREHIERLMIETRDIPTRRSLLDVPAIWDQVAYGDVVRSMLEETHLRPTANWPVVAEHLDPALQRVAFDERDPTAALETAASRVREQL